MTHARTISRPQRRNAGFTLVETLLALAILVILTGVVAMGVPVAWRTFTTTVGAANAQIALSTATSELRNELGCAQSVETQASNGEQVVTRYQDGQGYWAQLVPPAEGEQGTIEKHVYYGGASGDAGAEAADQKESLVTLQASSDFSISFSEIVYEDGIFKVKDLKVYDKANSDAPFASQDEYDIEALMIQGDEG